MTDKIKEMQRELGAIQREQKALEEQFNARKRVLYQKIGEQNPRVSFPSKEFLELVHIKVIEGEGINEAVDLTLAELSKTDAWYNDIKYYQIDYSKEIVDKYKNTRGYKRLVSEGGLSTRTLKKSKHTASHFKQLGVARAICDRFDNLENRVSLLEMQTGCVAEEFGEHCLEHLQGTKVSLQERKRIARFLKLQDWSVERIAEGLAVSPKTIRRYLTDT